MDVIRLKEFQLKKFFVDWVATASWVGFFPWAPGTYGSLVGLFLAYCLSFVLSGIIFKGLFWLFLLLIGTWAAALFDQEHQSRDNSKIVIDEVVGMGVSSWGLDWSDSLIVWGLSFLLFRFFDILKPPPILFLDRWSKKQSNPAFLGFGVMADDLLAGLMAFLILFGVRKSFVF